MDPPAQPKRRGRKKKTEAVPEKVVVAPKPEQPQIIQAKNMMKSPENLQKEREKVICKLEEKAMAVENAIDDKDLIEKVYRKMRKRLYFGGCEAEDEIERIRAGGVDHVEWQTIVQSELMSKVSSVVEFLLNNGPMTRIESDIFSSCVEAVRDYYIQRAACITDQAISSEKRQMYLKTTFYPSVGTAAYKLFSEVLSSEKPEVVFEHFRCKQPAGD